MTSNRQATAGVHRLRTTLLAWVAMIGLDFGLHAGLLAPLYDWGSPFLLQPGEAFGRSPAGYLGLLMLAAMSVLLGTRLSLSSGREGALIFGAGAAVIWGALLLGLWSISTAGPGLLLGWWLGQTLELAFAGYVVGAAASNVGNRSLIMRVIAVVLLSAVTAIALQTIGYAIAPSLAGG